MKRVALLGTVGLAFLAACSDQDIASPPDIEGPQFAIVDGSQPECNGQPCDDVLLLPPLVPSPKASDIPDEPFNPGLLARVEVHFLAGPGTEPPVPASLSCGTGPISATVSPTDWTVDEINEQFSYGFDTTPLALGYYRFCWLFGSGTEAIFMAARDVSVTDGSGSTPRNNARNPFYEVAHGRNLPLKYAGFAGFGCEDEDGDCIGGFVQGGGSLVTPQGQAGVAGNGQSGALFIREIECPTHPVTGFVGYADLDNPQAGNCYDFDASAFGGDPADLVAGMCFDLTGAAPGNDWDNAMLHHQISEGVWEVGEPTTGNLALSCGGFASSGLGKVMKTMARVIAPWLAPKPLYARDLPECSRCVGSPLIWAIPVALEKVADPGEGAVGEAILASVRATDEEDQPVYGAVVRFQVLEPGGPYSTVPVVTGTGGIASFATVAGVPLWVMQFPNPNRLEAASYGGGAGDVLAYHAIGGVVYPHDPASVTGGSERLVFEATATLAIDASFGDIQNGVLNEPMPSFTIEVTLADGADLPAGVEFTCTLTGAQQNNGTPTDFADGSTLSDTGTADGSGTALCTFDNVAITSNGALHFEADIVVVGATNSPLTIQSGKFHIKPN